MNMYEKVGPAELKKSSYELVRSTSITFYSQTKERPSTIPYSYSSVEMNAAM